MKTLVSALLLAGIVATPALAQSPKINKHAQASTTVVVDGQYRGQDPDANVRFDLRREWPGSGE